MQKRAKQQFQFCAMLSHGMVRPVTVGSFEILTAIDNIDVRLQELLINSSGIQCMAEGPIYFCTLFLDVSFLSVMEAGKSSQ